MPPPKSVDCSHCLTQNLALLRVYKLRSNQMGAVKNTDATCEEIRLQWQQIARSEVSRYRRRLGQLTPQQASEVESVFVSVANSMFEQFFPSNRSDSARDKCLKLWRPAVA